MVNKLHISIVVAVAENWAIGHNNQLMWRLSSDLKIFKSITSGHTIIMGRKTYDSIGKALPHRNNIVISRNNQFKAENVAVASSLQEALMLCDDKEQVFIIGGAQVYVQAMPMVDTIYLTKVHKVFDDADTFFPPLRWEEWTIMEQEIFIADAKNEYDFTFYKLAKKS